MGEAQAANRPKIRHHENHPTQSQMGLIVLEALVAGGLLVAIVWWTMFSGREKGELKDKDSSE